MYILRGIDTFSGEGYSSELFLSPFWQMVLSSCCHPSDKGSTLKGMNLLPWGANYFFLEKIPFSDPIWKGFNTKRKEFAKLNPFQKAIVVPESKKGSHKSCQKVAENALCISILFKCIQMFLGESKKNKTLV